MTDLVQKLVVALQDCLDRIEKSEFWWMDCPDRGGFDAEAIRAALSEAKAGGWVAVPVEPTPEMIAAALRECGGIGGGSCGEHTGVDGSDLAWVWDVMLAARPLPAPPAQRGEG